MYVQFIAKNGRKQFFARRVANHYVLYTDYFTKKTDFR